jgi:tRNA A-37 threonylcarbamoyl transferase component Bud32
MRAVAERISDGAGEVAPTEPSLERETLRIPVEEEGTLSSLQDIARVAGAYRSLARLDLRPLAPERDAPHRRWGRLLLMEKVGEGAAAEVFRARDTLLDHDVALKLFKVRHLTEADRQTVLEEGRRHARVKHSNVATIHDADEHDGRIGISMEYIDGETLHEVVKKQGPRGASEAAQVGIELCRAVAAVHAQGLVHGDIKAHNVIREKGGRIVLMDFSTSRPLAASPDRSRASTEGTPLYMAPELFEGSGPSPLSDVYALGVLLFHLATGSYPVRARSLDELRDRISRGERQSLYDLRPDLHPGFVRTVEKALRTEPERRFPSVGALGAALAAVEEPSAPPVVLRLLGACVAVVALVVLLGFVSSTAFNLTMGRPAEYAGESGMDWLIWGVRALIAPAVYILLAAAALRVLAPLWRALKALAPVGRGVRALRAWLARSPLGRHLTDPVVLAQALFAVGLLALGAVCWHYSDLISAFRAYVYEADAAELAPLRPDRLDTHIAYGQTLDMLILALALAWTRVFRAWKRGRPHQAVVPLASTIAVIAAALVLWVAPYQILFHNEFEKVEIEQTRGYVLGEKDGELLLYLPGAAKGSRRVFVAAGDPRLHRLKVMESAFSQ